MNKADTTLDKFMLRARRIQAHSLAADPKKIHELANLKYDVSFSSDGTTTLTQKLPDEESFESLAARTKSGSRPPSS